MSVECQVNIKSQSELDIGGRETCFSMIKSVLLLLPVSCFSGYWDFLQTPRPGRLAHKMTVFVSNKTCSEDFIMAGNDDADSINVCKNSCINHEQCTAFSFLSRHNRNIEVDICLSISDLL